MGPLSAKVALFLDVDGTILDIAETPRAVVVPTGLREGLRWAERQLGGALALVSGRTIADVDRLFEPLRLRAAGVHGAEFRFQPDKSINALAAAARLPSSLAPAVEHAVSPYHGLIVENKGFAIAVHYRLNPEAAGWLRRTLQNLLQAMSLAYVQVLEAHYAYELKPADFDKGKAIALFLKEEPFRGRRPIFVGDDITDEAGFAEVTARGGLAYSVGRQAPGVAGVFSSPGSVRAWLTVFASGPAE
jgi:trehalose 6-phosphate phosphatase